MLLKRLQESREQVFFATSLDNLVGLARANSLWPLPFATSCCGIEFMSTMASHYDIGRFGAERLSFSGSSSGRVDGDGNDLEENGAGSEASVFTDGRASLGIVSRCLCLFRWYF